MHAVPVGVTLLGYMGGEGENLLAQPLARILLQLARSPTMLDNEFSLRGWPGAYCKRARQARTLWEEVGEGAEQLFRFPCRPANVACDLLNHSGVMLSRSVVGDTVVWPLPAIMWGSAPEYRTDTSAWPLFLQDLYSAHKSSTFDLRGTSGLYSPSMAITAPENLGRGMTGALPFCEFSSGRSCDFISVKGGDFPILGWKQGCLELITGTHLSPPEGKEKLPAIRRTCRVSSEVNDYTEEVVISRRIDLGSGWNQNVGYVRYTRSQLVDDCLPMRTEWYYWLHPNNSLIRDNAQCVRFREDLPPHLDRPFDYTASNVVETRQRFIAFANLIDQGSPPCLDDIAGEKVWTEPSPRLAFPFLRPVDRDPHSW